MKTIKKITKDKQLTPTVVSLPVRVKGLQRSRVLLPKYNQALTIWKVAPITR